MHYISHTFLDINVDTVPQSIYKCEICGNKNRSLGSSKKHVNKVHNLQYEDYIDRYGSAGVQEVEFSCGICEAVMSCNGVTIASHMSAIHKLTMAEYQAKHVKVKTVKPGNEVGMPDLDDQAAVSLLTPITGLECSGVQVKQELQEGEQTQQGEEEKKEQTEQQEGQEEDSGGVFGEWPEERPWYQSCLYTCQVCHSPYYSTSALNNHAKSKHGLDREAYLAQFGEAGTSLQDYDCKLCGRTLKCEGKALGSHMKNVHKMTIEQYSELYEPERHSYHDPNLYCEHYLIETEEGAQEDLEIIEQDSNEVSNDSSSLNPLSHIGIENIIGASSVDEDGVFENVGMIDSNPVEEPIQQKKCERNILLNRLLDRPVAPVDDTCSSLHTDSFVDMGGSSSAVDYVESVVESE